MVSLTDSSLLNKLELENSDFSNLSQNFFEYLKPFSDFITFDFDSKKPKKKNSKTTKINNKNEEITTDSKLIRPLAKQFYGFISRALKLLPSRLSEIHKSSNGNDLKDADELFCVYKLCLECLTCISSCLECKSWFSIYLHRVSFIRYYVIWGKYIDAEVEGFWILEKLRSVNSLSKKKTTKKIEKEILLPELILGENEDPELARLIVEIVVSLVKCSAKSQRKEVAVYQRVISLVEQTKPWLRVLDSKVFERLQLELVNNLYRCTLFVLGEDLCLSEDLVCMFCMTTLTECKKSSMRDHFFKMAYNICSCLSSQWNSRSSLILDILKCVLDFSVCECKVGLKDTVNEFFSVVHFCLKKCRVACTDSCIDFGRSLEKISHPSLKVLAPIDSILRLYAGGLCLTESNIQPSGFESESSLAESLIMLSFDSGNDLLYLTDVLGSLESYFRASNKCSSLEYSISCKSQHGRLSFLSYLNALAFFSRPFAELVTGSRKLFLTENKYATYSPKLNYIMDAFQQFVDAFLLCPSFKSEKEREKFNESQDSTLLYVAISALIISLRTDKNIEKSVHHIDCLMSSWWIQLQQMKFLIQSLYNIGADLYNANKLKQALVVFELCSRCAWTRVSFVCDKRIESSGVIHDDWSEEAISGFVTEACSKCVTLLDALHQCEGSGFQKNRIVIASLVNWSAVASSNKNLGGPTSLMRRWVKIMCKDYMDVDTIDNAPTIYSLLCTSSTTFEERTIGIILEQELLAYEEMEKLNTNLCQSMQMKIIDILVHNVYVTKDYLLKKSTTLIKKGRIARARGIDGLNSCIDCLSEAISELQAMNQIDVSNESPAIIHPISYNLGQAFFLQALCIQEAQPNSEVFFKDLPRALKLWSSINWSLAVQDELENGIRLLCCIADLLLIKGYFYLKNDIFQMLITLLERNSFPPKKCFAMLWADRRLTHALCTKPIDECVISSFAHHFSVSTTDTVGFWVSCIEDSQALLVGLRQKFSLYDSISPQVGHGHPGNPLGSNVTVDEVREVVSTITSSVSTIKCNFLVGHLYYDLCERLITSGQLIQALSFATEALDLRTKLLHKKFICTLGKQPQSTSDTRQESQQNEFDHVVLEVIGSVASEVWPHMCSKNSELNNLSQWNVLRCYLESILQVGSIHEALGNASIAEAFLVRGKDMSYKQGLPIFRVAFSSVLGEIYCKKQLWEMAETELNSARQILEGSSRSISCKQCIMTLEVTLDQRFGCLFRSRSVDNNVSATLDHYKSALGKLKHVEWDSSSRFSEEASQLDNCSRQVDTEGPHLDIEYKTSRRASKQVMKERNSKPEPKTRMTRSRSRSCNNKSVNFRGEAESHENGRHLELNMPSKNEFGCAEIFVNNRRNFGKRLLLKVMDSGKMQDFIDMKWEFQRRRLSLRLLNELGTCIGEYGKVEEMHEIFWQSFTMLFDGKSLSQTYSGPHSLLLEFIGKESHGDFFTIECAVLLYNLSWFSLKTIRSRNACCDLSRIQLPLVVSLLLKAFILSREVPFLFQKVSRLLATVSIISTSIEPSCLPLFPGKALRGSHWTAFFHQASLGTYFNHQLCSNPNILLLILGVLHFQGSHSTASTETLTAVCDLLRSAPDRIDDLEKLVNDFYQLLPSITVICVSLLGSDYASLLSHLLPDHFSSPALLLLSRLNSDNDPIVMLLQSDVIREDMDHNAKYIKLREEISSNKEWRCPWGCTVVDEIAPQFRRILTENYLSSSFTPTHDTQDKKHLWWEWRRKLNNRLDKFVRSVEETWLGPWKCLLLGERLDSMCLDSVLSRMTSALKRKYQFGVNENLLRVILGGAKSVSEIEKCISQMLLHKGCIASMGNFPHKKCDGSSVACAQDESLSTLLHQLLVESGCELDVECDRQSIIMVLDSDVQMLPWENLPTLKKTEVYRMPSVVSICALINVNIHRQEQSGSIDGTFPSIDPLDAFYLLNPSGDLDYTQVKFEEWFRNQKLEGKAGTPPSVEELFLALKNHDLFIYFGHGSGEQYIPGREIQKLDNCAATLLMGCSSGCLLFMGSYNPQGVVLSYLLAGSPAIVANLWEVTDKDIDRFGKAMFNAWLVERSTSTIGCNPRNLVEEFESMNIASSEENGAREVARSRRSRSD
ncbi:hypothetical protein AQUCO_07400015v1, partial [Aquilegia coerulea]